MSSIFFYFYCRSVITSQLLKIFPVCVRSDFRGKVTKCEFTAFVDAHFFKGYSGREGVLPREKSTKLYLHLKKWLEKAAVDYNMIKEGDRILVGVSGGLDSLVLLNLLNTSMVFLPQFSILAVNIDLGFDEEYRGYAELENCLRKNGHEYIMEKTDIGPLAHSDYNKRIPVFSAQG